MSALYNIFILLALLFLVSEVTAGCEDCVVTNECYQATCTNNQCVKTPKENLPVGCCLTALQCDTGLGPSPYADCITPSCYTTDYICANKWTCPLPEEFPPIDETSCETELDCPNSHCLSFDCIDDTCALSDIQSFATGCCSATTDCPDIPCMTRYCDTTLRDCVYQNIIGCTVGSSPSNSPTPAKPSLSPSKSPSLSPVSESTTPTPSSSTSDILPSDTASTTTTFTPTATPSHSADESIEQPTSTETSTTTTTSSSTNSPSISASVTATTSRTVSSSPTPSSTISESESASAQETVSISVTSSTISTPPSSGGHGWLWIVFAILVLIVVAALIAGAAFFYLRRRYLQTRLQPDDLIYDEEFPM